MSRQERLSKDSKKYENKPSPNKRSSNISRSEKKSQTAEYGIEVAIKSEIKPALGLPSTIVDNIASLLTENQNGISLNVFVNTYNEKYQSKHLNIQEFGFQHCLQFVLGQPEIMKLHYSVADNNLKVVPKDFKSNFIADEIELRRTMQCDVNGFYTLRSPRFMFGEGTVFENEIKRRFHSKGRIKSIGVSDFNIYIRYKKLEDAVSSLLTFAPVFGVTLATISEKFTKDVEQQGATAEVGGKENEKKEDDIVATRPEVQKEPAIYVKVENIDPILKLDDIESRLRKYNPITINIQNINNKKLKIIKSFYAKLKFAPWDSKKVEEVVSDLHKTTWKGTKTIMTCTVKAENEIADIDGISTGILMKAEKETTSNSVEMRSSWWNRKPKTKQDDIDLNATTLLT